MHPNMLRFTNNSAQNNRNSRIIIYVYGIHADGGTSNEVHSTDN